MFNRVSKLFTNEKTAWHETDIKHFVTQFLQQCYKTDGVYCEQAVNGTVIVRVNSPALYQAVVLQEYELSELLQKEAQFEVKKLVVQR